MATGSNTKDKVTDANNKKTDGNDSNTIPFEAFYATMKESDGK